MKSHEFILLCWKRGISGAEADLANEVAKGLGVEITELADRYVSYPCQSC